MSDETTNSKQTSAPVVQGVVMPLSEPFSTRQPLWLVVNGEPALRYYVRPHNRGHVLAFNADGLGGVYYDYPCFYASQAAVLLQLIEGAENRLRSAVDDLARRRKQLIECMA